jgi:general secretion pathway protein D
VVGVGVENVELQTLIKQVSALTGTTFLYDPAQVKGTITLVSPKPLAPAEALSVLESALALHGYTLLKRAVGTWIVPAAQAAPQAMRLEVIPLNYARAEEVAATLAGVAPPGIRIAPYAPTNSLLVSGDPEAVEELLGVLSREDPVAAVR